MTSGQLVTTGMVLNRIDYGEADRILTWLTPDQGKVSLLARAVKKQKSKLAGGIELFSESQISFVRGKGNVGTLTSARLRTHFSNIVKDMGRTNAAYEMLKIINRTTEERADHEWYELLKNSLAGLDDPSLLQASTELWFNLHWLKLSGRSPNLRTDVKNHALKANHSYNFDFESMAFYIKEDGNYSPNHIKLLRLAISASSPLVLAKLTSSAQILDACNDLSQTMISTFISV